MIYLARDGNRPPEYDLPRAYEPTLEEQGELNPGQTLVISTTTDRPYEEFFSEDDPKYTSKNIQIVDGEPDMSDQNLFPPRSTAGQRMVYERIPYWYAKDLLLSNDPVADGVVMIEE